MKQIIAMTTAALFFLTACGGDNKEEEFKVGEDTGVMEGNPEGEMAEPTILKLGETYEDDTYQTTVTTKYKNTDYDSFREFNFFVKQCYLKDSMPPEPSSWWMRDTNNFDDTGSSGGNHNGPVFPTQDGLETYMPYKEGDCVEGWLTFQAETAKPAEPKTVTFINQGKTAVWEVD